MASRSSLILSINSPSRRAVCFCAASNATNSVCSFASCRRIACSSGSNCALRSSAAATWRSSAVFSDCKLSILRSASLIWRWSRAAISSAVFPSSRLAQTELRSSASAASSFARLAICALRSSKEAARTSLLPPKTIPSAETNSPASVAIASVGSLFLHSSASCKSEKMTTLPSNCLTSGSSDRGEVSLSLAHASAPLGRTFRTDCCSGPAN